MLSSFRSQTGGKDPVGPPPTCTLLGHPVPDGYFESYSPELNGCGRCNCVIPDLKDCPDVFGQWLGGADDNVDESTCNCNFESAGCVMTGGLLDPTTRRPSKSRLPMMRSASGNGFLCPCGCQGKITEGYLDCRCCDEGKTRLTASPMRSATGAGYCRYNCPKQPAEWTDCRSFSSCSECLMHTNPCATKTASPMRSATGHSSSIRAMGCPAGQWMCQCIDSTHSGGKCVSSSAECAVLCKPMRSATGGRDIDGFLGTDKGTFK